MVTHNYQLPINNVILTLIMPMDTRDAGCGSLPLTSLDIPRDVKLVPNKKINKFILIMFSSTVMCLGSVETKLHEPLTGSKITKQQACRMFM